MPIPDLLTRFREAQRKRFAAKAATVPWEYAGPSTEMAGAPADIDAEWWPVDPMVKLESRFKAKYGRQLSEGDKSWLANPTRVTPEEFDLRKDVITEYFESQGHPVPDDFIIPKNVPPEQGFIDRLRKDPASFLPRDLRVAPNENPILKAATEAMRFVEKQGADIGEGYEGAKQIEGPAGALFRAPERLKKDIEADVRRTAQMAYPGAERGPVTEAIETSPATQGVTAALSSAADPLMWGPTAAAITARGIPRILGAIRTEADITAAMARTGMTREQLLYAKQANDIARRAGTADPEAVAREMVEAFERGEIGKPPAGMSIATPRTMPKAEAGPKLLPRRAAAAREEEVAEAAWEANAGKYTARNVMGEPIGRRTKARPASYADEGGDAVVPPGSEVKKPGPSRAGRPSTRPEYVGKRTQAVGPDPNQKFDMEYELVELDDIVTSHDTKLRENPAFPKDAQPRNRGKMSSEMQIQKIVNEFAPEEYVTDRGVLDRGPQILGPDDAAEMGNVRTIVLRRIVEAHPEKAAAYQAALRAALPGMGLSPEAAKEFKFPVLVRRRMSDVPDRAEWAELGNRAAGLEMSATEIAAGDVKRVDEAALGQIVVPESSTLEAALTSKENAGFVTGFMSKLTPEQAGRLMTDDGRLNADGAKRIKAALFRKVFPGEAGDRLLKNFTEEVDVDVLSVGRGIDAALPELAKAEASIRAGERDASLSFADDIAKAVDALAKIRRQRIPIQDYLDQKVMFGRELTPLQEKLLVELDARARSQAKIRTFISGLADEVMATTPKSQATMFGPAEVPAKEKLLARTVEKQGVAEEGLFAEKPAAPAEAPVPKPARRGKGAKSERVSPLAHRGTILPEVKEPSPAAVTTKEAEVAKPVEKAPEPAVEPAPERPVAELGRDGGAGGRGGGGVAEPGERILVSRAEHTPKIDTGNVPESARKGLNKHQIDGVASAVRAMDKDGGFILADGPGVGKTRQILATAKLYADKGQAVLIIAPAAVIKPHWEKVEMMGGSYVKDAKAMGIPIQLHKIGPLTPGKIHVSTYERMQDFGLQDIPSGTILVWDEAHYLKNAGATRAEHGMMLTARAKAVLFATATPADKATHIDYMARAGMLEGKGYERQMSDLGLRPSKVKTGRGERIVWVEDPKVGWREVRRRFSALFDRLTARGQMLKREISMKGVEVEFADMELPEEGIGVLAKIEAEYPVKNPLQKAARMGHQRRAQETYKIPRILEMLKEELAAGRKVVIFANRVNASDVIARETQYVMGEKQVIERLIHSSEGTLKLLKESLKEQGIKFAELHGGVSKLGQRDSMQRFQEGDAQVIIATVESGGTGINLDDVIGDKPRSMLIMTAPFSAMENVQAIGRVWRLMTKSNPKIRYVFANTPIDEWNKAIIMKKMSLLGATVKGEMTKVMEAIDDPELAGMEPPPAGRPAPAQQVGPSTAGPSTAGPGMKPIKAEIVPRAEEPMTAARARAEADRLYAEEKVIEEKIFGKEGAEKYKRLQRRANSMTATGAEMDAASKEIEEMEATLSQEQQNKLFGIGEEGPVYEDMNDLADDLEAIEGSEDVDEMTDYLALRSADFYPGKDPAKMNDLERRTFAMFKRAGEIARERGWDTSSMTARFLEKARNRYSDPEDARLMLESFFEKPEPVQTETIPESRQIAPEAPKPAPVAPRPPAPTSAPPAATGGAGKPPIKPPGAPPTVPPAAQPPKPSGKQPVPAPKAPAAPPKPATPGSIVGGGGKPGGPNLAQPPGPGNPPIPPGNVPPGTPPNPGAIASATGAVEDWMKKHLGTLEEFYQAAVGDNALGTEIFMRIKQYYIQKEMMTSEESDTMAGLFTNEKLWNALTKGKVGVVGRVMGAGFRSGVSTSLRMIPFIGKQFGVTSSRSKAIFRAVEGIKELDKAGQPVLGTRIFERNPDGSPMVDPVTRQLVMKGWRYTKQQATANWNALSDKEQEIALWLAADREMVKQAFDVTGSVEGYMHHFWKQGYIARMSRIIARHKTAASRKLRGEAPGFVEDAEAAHLKMRTELKGEALYNGMIDDVLARVTKPIAAGAQPDPGWIEIPKMAPTRSGRKIGQLAGGKQIQKAVYDELIRYSEPMEEANLVSDVLRDFGRQVKMQLLEAPMTVATNAIGGALQYAGKMVEDLIDGSMSGTLKPFALDLFGLLDAMRPATIVRFPAEAFGGRANIRTQYGPQTGAIGRLNSLMLFPFEKVENYFKRAIMSATARTKGMTLDAKAIAADLDALTVVQHEIDQWAFDYFNEPRGMTAFKQSTFGALTIPFPTYSYKLARMYGRLAGAFNPLVDQGTGSFWGDLRSRLVKILTLATALGGAYAFMRRKDEKTGKYIEGMPWEVDKTARFKIGERNGKELYLRGLKYPWLNAVLMGEAGISFLKGEGLGSSQDFLAEFISSGPLLNGIDAARRMGNKYNYYKPEGARWGETLKPIIPGFRVIQGVKRLMGGPRYMPQTFWEAFSEGLPIPDSGSRVILDKTTGLPIIEDPTLEELKFWGGFNIKEIDPRKYSEEKQREYANALEAIDRAGTVSELMNAARRLEKVDPEQYRRLESLISEKQIRLTEEQVGIIQMMHEEKKKEEQPKPAESREDKFRRMQRFREAQKRRRELQEAR